MRTFGHFLLAFFFSAAQAVATVAVPSYPQAGVLAADNRGVIDPNVDYERFSGRVSDKDDSERVFKIQVENNNTKFFRSGDLVLFGVNRRDTRGQCRGFVRNVEDFHFTIYVENLSPCFARGEYFRRGTVLNFTSRALALRIFEASKFREQLILRKEDFLKQMNGINHFLWTFDQQKVKTASRFDEEINRLQREKRKALDDMITLKQERLVLQNELMKKLNELDESLIFYRVERQELLTDRWELDHDQGLPVGPRPQKLRQD